MKCQMYAGCELWEVMGICAWVFMLHNVLTVAGSDVLNSFKRLKYEYFSLTDLSFRGHWFLYGGLMDYRYVHLVWFLKSQLWGTHLLALYELAEMEYFSKNLHLCSTEERKSNIWDSMMVSSLNVRIFLFGWSVPLRAITNLGVKIDADLKLDSQIRAVVKSSFFQLRQLAKVKPFLSRQHFETVIHAFVTTRLDYCNALYVGVSGSSVARLQMVQNAAARLLTQIRAHFPYFSLTSLAAHTF